MISTNSVPSTFSWGWAQTMTGAATVNVAANPSLRIARFMISWPLGRFELCSAAGSSHPGSADGAHSGQRRSTISPEGRITALTTVDSEAAGCWRPFFPMPLVRQPLNRIPFLPRPFEPHIQTG
jgi:hypothetical protein